MDRSDFGREVCAIVRWEWLFKALELNKSSLGKSVHREEMMAIHTQHPTQKTPDNCCLWLCPWDTEILPKDSKHSF